MKSSLLRLAIPAVLAIAAGFVWLGSRPEAVQATTVVTAYPSQALSILNASGYVVAQRKAAISTRAQGRLQWLGVAEGSVVKKNEVIARIENDELSAQAAQAQAQVGVAQVELDEAVREADRSSQLLARAFISESAHDAAQARVARARANLRAARAGAAVAQAALAQSEIRAPFDGVVLTKSANVGDNITPFSSAADSKGAVVTLADMSTLEVEADISEANLDRIQIGQPVEISLDAIPGERFPGKVARMVPTIDRAKATRLTKLQFETIDPRILPDMAAKVVFLERRLTDEERTPYTAVPSRAVRQAEGSGVVFQVLEVDGRSSVKAILVSAEAIARSGGKEGLVQVDGLLPGDRVVLSPPDDLSDGDTIELKS